MLSDCNYIEADLLIKIEAKLSEVLSLNTEAKLLLEAMRYSCLSGGKRIRPLLTIAAGYLSSAKLDTLITVGAAIELIHCYSLIHDDLPAMDNDDLRRGKLTCHKQYNEAIAILAGDALQPLAIETLASVNLELDAIVKLKIISLLTSLSGINGMVGGQTLDLISTGSQLNLVQLRQMHMLKTGGLIKSAILAGYLCGTDYDNNVYQGLNQIADNLGILFQITDDILDATANTEVLGKTANKDFVNNKATYVSILGLAKAHELADNAYQEIQLELHKLEASKSYLALLASLVYKRRK